MRPAYNIGALPVYASEQDARAAQLPPGLKVAVDAGLDADGNRRYTVFESRVFSSGPGLSGFWSSLVSIGSLVAAPFTGGLSLAFGQPAAGAIAAKEQQGAQEKAIGKSFEELAKQVTELFNSIQLTPGRVITQADAAQAEQALSQLAQAAQQYSSISYIARQWESPAYRPVYEERLKQIRQAAQASGGGSAATTGGTTQAAGAQVDTSQLALLGGLALVAILFLVRR